MLSVSISKHIHISEIGTNKSINCLKDITLISSGHAWLNFIQFYKHMILARMYLLREIFFNKSDVGPLAFLHVVCAECLSML